MKHSTIREVAKAMYQKNIKLTTICDVLQVHRTTIWRWLQPWKAASHVPVGRPGKLNACDQQFCRQFVNDHPTACLKDVAKNVFDNFKKIVSITLIHRTLKLLGFTLKKATTRFDEQDHRKVRAFLETMPANATKEWLSLDECGFLMNHTRPYARSTRGTRAVVSRPGPRGQRYSLLLCISPAGVVASSYKSGGFKSPAFREFVETMPENVTACLDNCSTHHATKSLQRLGLSTIAETAENRNIDLKYLPSYSPQLNPVELCFNCIKSHVRRVMPRTATDLQNAIHHAISLITPSQCQNFYHHCWAPA